MARTYDAQANNYLVKLVGFNTLTSMPLCTTATIILHHRRLVCVLVDRECVHWLQGTGR
jgi:hypothetical protein